MPIALMSVTDKTGLVDFARGLADLEWEIISTGGTASLLREAGITVREVSEETGLAEMLDGRVKTLHPAIHGGILARRDEPAHMQQLSRAGYRPIDLVVVNLYAFAAAAATAGIAPDEVIERIDIGGPALLRSAAKNFAHVLPVVDPADYPQILAALRASKVDISLRRRLAEKVFAHTSAYDAAVANWFAAQSGDAFPERLTLAFQRAQTLRYGENPDQKAAYYVEHPGAGLAALRQLGGKELSFNNLLDLDGALMAIEPFLGETCCAIIKHTTPSGLATGATALEAYQKALATDPVSAFGSVIAFTTTVDDETANAVASLFVECLVAPAFSDGAIETLGRKKNLRILAGRAAWSAKCLDIKRVRGGILVQDRVAPPAVSDEWKVVTRRQPTAGERRDLEFAWRAVASVKSNAIVLAKDGATIGIGAGQMSRVDASFLAVHKARAAGLETAGAVLGSDAFFPFRDGVDHAAQAGVRAVIQPGGSVRDDEVIAAADEHGISMIMTGRRLFRH
jgi:phosphoribosylaminoimidazolecarboxamide formyltransferase / IMP cyclohydrolase